MFISIQIINAQWGNPIHYTQNNGLSTQAMFSSAIDNDGFVWFASEAGASRFNGKEFEHFRANEGISTNSFLYFVIDNENNIWAKSLTGEIYCYSNGKWIENINTNNANSVKNTIKISNNELYVFNENKLLKYELNKDTINYKTIIDFKNTDFFISNFFLKDNQFVFINKEKVYFYNKTTLKKEQGQSKSKEYICFDGKIKLLSNQLSSVKLSKNLFAYTIKFKDRKLYVASLEGFFIFDQINDTLFSLNNSFSLNLPCVDFEFDKNENLWICTRFDGVYFFPRILGKAYKFENLKGDIFLKTLPNPSGGFKHLSSLGKIIQSDNGIFKIEENYNITSYDIQYYKKTLYTLTTNNLFINNKSYNDNIFWYKSLWIDTSKNETYIGCGDRFIKATPKFETLFNNVNPNRIYSLLKQDDQFIFGTDYGVFKFKNKKITKYELGKYSYLKNISQIKYTEDSVYLFVSRNHGVLLKKNEDYVFLKEQNELINEPSCILSPKKGVILIGTRNGLNYLTYSINPLKINSIKVYSNFNGLLDFNVNNIEHNNQNNDIIITYNNSFQTLQLNEFEKIKTNSKLYFKSISSDYKKIMDLRHVNFSYNENDIEIEFNSIDYAKESKRGYLYRLNNINKKWSVVNGNVVKFSDLSPGSYEFELKMRNQFKNNHEVLKLKFKIIPAFWQTLWFRILIALFLIVLLILIVRNRYENIIKKQKKKNELEKEHATLELEAIKAQINPHFIYNCLNSIQHSILKNDNEGAEKQLNTFSKLVRETLDYSKMDFISLEKEMSYLEKYLEMEKLRFKENLEYQVITSIEDKENTLIPCLLIQPFVENAIKHGLSINENEVSNIRVYFKIHKNHIICIVEDSGSGINFEKLNNKEIPSGMKLSNKRAETYNRIYNMDILIKIINKSEKEKNNHGTMAIISIPLRKNN